MISLHTGLHWPIPYEKEVLSWRIRLQRKALELMDKLHDEEIERRRQAEEQVRQLKRENYQLKHNPIEVSAGNDIHRAEVVLDVRFDRPLRLGFRVAWEFLDKGEEKMLSRWAIDKLYYEGIVPQFQEELERTIWEKIQQIKPRGYMR